METPSPTSPAIKAMPELRRQAAVTQLRLHELGLAAMSQIEVQQAQILIAGKQQ